jgi:ElaA protein
MDWQWSRFQGLGVDNLYDALALRSHVFGLEQNCVYVDPDGADRHSWHLLGRDARGALQAYLRVVDAGVKFPELSMGRVVTHIDSRATGLGRRLVGEAMRWLDTEFPAQPLRISAQAHLQRFYGSFGFAPVGEPYLEDNILHIEMLKATP